MNTYGYTDVRLPWGWRARLRLGREHGTARDRELHRTEGDLDESRRLSRA
jgi:hypothetical protein